MSAKTNGFFLPDYENYPHPGETLLEILNAENMSQADLALRTGLTKKTINQIIKGNAPISVETALLLEKVFKYSANFWLNLETKYATNRARKERSKELSQYIDELIKFPIKELVDYGYILKKKSKIDQLEELLKFFGAASFGQLFSFWETKYVNYRKSLAFESDDIHVFTWLKCGEKQAEKIECKPYNATSFRETLKEIRKLTILPFDSASQKIVDLCREVGVAVAFVPSFKNCKINGAAWWPNKENKAIMQFSLRGKKADIFWFTFFHECCHILNHGKKSIYRDNKPGDSEYRFNERLELEADEFSSNLLIPKKDLTEFIELGEYQNEEKLMKFAKKQKISAGIVVGQLMHLGKMSWGSPQYVLRDNSYSFD